MLHARPIDAHDVEHEVNNAHDILYTMLGICGDN